MRYYKLIFNFHNETLDPDSYGPKIYPSANGTRIINNNGFLSTFENQGKIYFENIVDDAPIFDYFYLYNSTYQKEYDWILLDSYSFIGNNIPQIRGFLVSQKFKDVLEKFVIAKPYRFYESFLMYQGKKLTYYIFHLAQNEWKEYNSEISDFFQNGKLIKVKSNKDLKQLVHDGKFIEPNSSARIIMNNFADIFYFARFGYIISENLRDEIIKHDLLDFDFIPIENISFEFKNY